MAYSPSCSTRIDRGLVDLAAAVAHHGHDDDRETGIEEGRALGAARPLVEVDLVPNPVPLAGLVLVVGGQDTWKDQRSTEAAISSPAIVLCV